MTLPNDTIDHEARAQAGLANQRMDGHEALCAERYRVIAEALDRLEAAGEQRRDSIKGIYDRLSLERGALIVLLIGIVGYLFVKAYG
jgi:hypothetical protein